MRRENVYGVQVLTILVFQDTTGLLNVIRPRMAHIGKATTLRGVRSHKISLHIHLISHTMVAKLSSILPNGLQAYYLVDAVTVTDLIKHL